MLLINSLYIINNSIYNVNYILSICLRTILAIWCFPYLMYWNERRLRCSIFIKWNLRKDDRKIIKLFDKLPVGILLYINDKLTFANGASEELILGNDQGSILNIITAIEQHEGLKNIIFNNLPFSQENIIDSKSRLNESQCNTIKYLQPVSKTTITLEIHALDLGKKEERKKIFVLQDKSTYNELQNQIATNDHQKKFFSEIVHELRNPLHGILGIFENFIQEATKPCFISQCKIGINTIKLMMGLINDVLDLSQMESNSIRLVPENINVDEVVHNTMDLMAYKYKSKGITLEYKSLNVKPNFKCDKNRYIQILLNLLNNSFKFTEAGGVCVTTEYAYATNQLYTTVTDTGVGIKEEDEEKLFSYFGKLKDTSMINPQGVGLGLHISKKLTEAMGGTITLKSKYNAGTSITFSIENRLLCEEIKNEVSPALRLTKFANSVNVTIPPCDDNSDCSCQVLIVDDEFICANALLMNLRYLNYTAEISITGTQAIKLVKKRIKNSKNIYKVIFIDIHMPIKNGLETTVEILELCKELEKPYIIGVSGDEDESIMNKCKSIGFNQVITKPISRDHIKVVMNDIRIKGII